MVTSPSGAGLPLVSIITVCFNAAPTICATMDSLDAQVCRDFEWIVIDGGSTDGTREFLEAHQARIAHFVSEPDAGIYDAMNKGVRASTGQWLLFLNADDVLADPAVLLEISPMLRDAGGDTGVVYGDVYYTDGTKKWRRTFHWVTRRNLLYGDLCHQAVFARHWAFQLLGEFDATLRINADYDWLLRVFRSPLRIRYVPREVATFSVGGMHGRDRRFLADERLAVRRRFASRGRLLVGEFLLRVELKLRKMMGQTT
jgi:glycosyltransferase involved in cell wall biosynthesis